MPSIEEVGWTTRSPPNFLAVPFRILLTGTSRSRYADGGNGLFRSMDLPTNHIYPVGDIKPHVINGSACWCEPYIDTDHDLAIHNAADGREFFEEEEREAFLQGLSDVKAGKVIPLSDLRNHGLTTNQTNSRRA